MNIIDTHQHLWDLQMFPYSWCAGAQALDRSFLLDEYIEAAAGTGIAKTVFVECDVDSPHSFGEAMHIQRLSEGNPLIGGIVASARPEQDDFEGQLDQLLKLPKLRGLRRVLHVVPDEISQSGRFVDNIRRLGNHQLTFDVCVLSRQLPLATALVDECPATQFILDHCGVPDVNSGELKPWCSDLADLARRPNVICKISGIAAQVDEAASIETLRPWVEQVIASFGWDRVVWGGDWPVCTLKTTLGRWVGVTRELVRGATVEQQQKLFYLNAERIYRL